jgi:hypothetical protein
MERNYDKEYEIMVHHLRNPMIAKDFFNSKMGPIKGLTIEWDTIKMIDKNFIDKSLSHLHTDLVFSCHMNEKIGYFHLIIEHQYAPQVLTVEQMRAYNLALSDYHMALGNQSLPIILNILYRMMNQEDVTKDDPYFGQFKNAEKGIDFEQEVKAQQVESFFKNQEKM